MNDYPDFRGARGFSLERVSGDFLLHVDYGSGYRTSMWFSSANLFALVRTISECLVCPTEPPSPATDPTDTRLRLVLALMPEIVADMRRMPMQGIVERAPSEGAAP